MPAQFLFFVILSRESIERAEGSPCTATREALLKPFPLSFRKRRYTRSRTEYAYTALFPPYAIVIA